MSAKSKISLPEKLIRAPAFDCNRFGKLHFRHTINAASRQRTTEPMYLIFSCETRFVRRLLWGMLDVGAVWPKPECLWCRRHQHIVFDSLPSSVWVFFKRFDGRFRCYAAPIAPESTEKKILHFIPFNTEIDTHTAHRTPHNSKGIWKFVSRKKKEAKYRWRRWKASRQFIQIDTHVYTSGASALSATNRIIYIQKIPGHLHRRYSRGRRSTIALTLFFLLCSFHSFQSLGSFRFGDFGRTHTHTHRGTHRKTSKYTFSFGCRDIKERRANTRKRSRMIKYNNNVPAKRRKIIESHTKTLHT